MTAHIVVVEDDTYLRFSLTNALKKYGYNVSSFANAKGVVPFIESHQSTALSVDLLISDIVLPDEDGYSIFNQLSAMDNLGKIFISSKTAIEDRIVGLRCGADDYIVKPLNEQELILRVSALLKRIQPRKIAPELISFADLTLNPETREIRGPHESDRLGENELQVLLALLAKKGKVCPRLSLAFAINRSADYVEGRGLDILVSRLRKKLCSIGQHDDYIVTAIGEGYLLASHC